MKNFKGLVKLDSKLVTPYWKWLVLFTGIAMIFGLTSQNGLNFMISFSLFAGTFTAYNFENTEKSNLNVLFATLPTNRKSMLAARYTFIFVVLVLSLIASFTIGFIMDLAFGNEIVASWYVMMLCLTVGIYLFNTGFQTPFFYAKGYTKGRLFLWIPIIVIMIIMNIHPLLNAFGVENTFNIFEIMARDMTLTSIIAVSVGVVAFITSYFASHKIYLKKDF